MNMFVTTADSWFVSLGTNLQYSRVLSNLDCINVVLFFAGSSRTQNLRAVGDKDEHGREKWYPRHNPQTRKSWSFFLIAPVVLLIVVHHDDSHSPRAAP